MAPEIGAMEFSHKIAKNDKRDESLPPNIRRSTTHGFAATGCKPEEIQAPDAGIGIWNDRQLIPNTRLYRVRKGYVVELYKIGEGKELMTHLFTPGDIVNGQALFFEDRLVSFAAAGAVELEIYDPDHIANSFLHSETCRNYLQRAEFARKTLIDHAVLNLNCLSSSQRVAHFFCELSTRLGIYGQARSITFTLPLMQRDLAGYLGNCAVHFNRIVRALRRENIMTWAGGRVVISRWDELARHGRFNPDYLRACCPDRPIWPRSAE